MQRTVRQIASLGVATAYILGTTILWIPNADAKSVEDQLQEAQDAFLFGDFGAAANGVIGLIGQGGLTPPILREANVLAAQCYLELGDEAAVDAAICAAHDADPLWQPSTNVLTDREVLRFATALRGCPETIRSTKPFFRSTPPIPDTTSGGSSAASGTDARPAESAPAGTALPKGAGLDSATRDSGEGVDDSGSTPWFKKPVAWIFGGAAAAVGVVLAMGGGGANGPGGPDGPENPGGIGDFPAAPED